MKKKEILLTFLISFFIISIILSPQRYISTAFNGISAWAFHILPSVFPFMILTRLLLELNVINKFFYVLNKPIQKVYKTSPLASYVFFMSILSGYPVGSKLIADLFESNKISRQDVFKMNSFCSNSGPMFIVGSVGASMLLSAKAGYILFACHILSALINGLIYRNIKVKSLSNQNATYIKKQNNVDFADIIASSLQAILNIGGIVCLFFIIIETLSPIISLFPSNIAHLLTGFIEITRGCLETARNTTNIKTATIICSFIISFGGLSTIIQAQTLLKNVKIPTSILILQKFSQAVIASILAMLLCNIFF